ncbi:glycoside hydrolase family 76 protein [Sphingobacterium sp. SRCM116780]|uniref:glycoside hydrolase family 76 protein n=1 Tax=Sphingobacterium sp. SRCM116780 TaxID=2907623 RepID=UPI001F415D5D|nr:glycoside hydrolase family 76 protein [Sphingobacterium sp. SRCM116780]UIR54728.1 glycoside hydrolase family 76 protein [Sphingobacterium sp. SRCM116780]
MKLLIGYSLIICAMGMIPISSNAQSNVNLTKTQQDLAQKLIQQNVDKAYQAFNQQVFDPVRKLYYRDTQKTQDVGAIWTQAIYWDMAMNAYKRNKTKENLRFIYDLYEGNKKHYAAYDWTNDKVWFIYDDIMWWVIAMARAYELTKDKQFLAHAESGFIRVWSGVPGIDIGSYDQEKSGMFWDWTFGRKGKMSCINYPTVIAAATLYEVTKKKEYLAKAKEIYDWSSNNLLDRSMGRIADSKHGDGQPNWTTHLYNQATAIGAGTILYKITKQKSYLTDAILIADYTKNVLSKADVLPYEKGEEQGVYAAILAQYMIRLIQDGKQASYLPWLRHTVTVGWGNRDQQRNLTTKDYTKKLDEKEIVSCYDASGIPALMLVLAEK